jgi:cGMP-dependent protein kinase 1
MGAAASTAQHSYNPPTAAGGRQKRQCGAKHRRGNLYEAASTEKDAKVELKSDISPSIGMNEPTKQILLDAIGGFFFLDSDEGESQTHIDLFMKALERATFIKEDYVMKEGEDGDKLYVVECGELDVTIDGQFIRTLHSGALFGELALLYNAPRSATIKCTSDCIIWCLDRSVFKAIQRVARSAMVMQRSEWLSMCPDISKLGSVELSRLMNSLESVEFKEGEVMHDFDDVASHVLLIERGYAKVECSADLGEMTAGEWDESLGVTRPMLETTSDAITNQIELHEGCLIGTSCLDVKARKTDAGVWKYKDGEVYCPIKITAQAGGVKCSVFHVDQFVHLYGDSPKRTSELRKTSSQEVDEPRVDAKHIADSSRGLEEKEAVPEVRKFDASKMELVEFLGQGGYGTVMRGKYEDESTDYAVKFLTKTTIMAKKQEQHVMNEKNLLASFSSPLILRLYGTYQTPTALVLVTENVDRGDLWSCMYENETYPEEDGGLPCDLIQFYFASVVIAMAYIHARKVTFRDLKPENIMLDGNGYIRLIDFGFAKNIPFEAIDKNGKRVIQHKSNTMCGTPEYLAPEFIFCEGNDHGVDLWALGVLLHEMLIQTTPFVVDDCEDIQKMFTRIATVKKVPIALDLEIDDKCSGSPHARELIFKLLQGDPRERLGYANHNTKSILKTPYLLEGGLDFREIESQEFVPHFIPPRVPVENEPPPDFQPFKGDDDIFRNF